MGTAIRGEHALERLVFFSDAVFAIAITLLVLEVKVPVLPKGSPDALYWNALADIIPSFMGYLLSFVVIGVFWIGHHRAFAMATRYSSKVLGWNLGLLCVIAFMPFITAFDAHNLNQRVPSILYCAALFVAGGFNAAVIHVATGPEMVSPECSSAEIAYVRWRSISVIMGAGTAIVLAFFVPQFGQMGLISIGLWRRVLTRGTAKPD
jgi:uncharacterized membrane protein